MAKFLPSLGFVKIKASFLIDLSSDLSSVTRKLGFIEN